jgi:hypothetical protein
MSTRRHIMNTGQHADALFASLANTPNAYREGGRLVASFTISL